MNFYDSEPKRNNFSQAGLQMRLELTLIDDRFCDLVSGQDTHTSPLNEVQRRHQLESLEMLREWRKKYDLEDPL